MMDMGALKKLIIYNRGKVLDLGKDGSTITPNDLMERMGYDFHSAYNVLCDLEGRGMIKGAGYKSVRPSVWIMTDKNEPKQITPGRSELSFELTKRGRRENIYVLESILG